jgi:hypothetical protein
MIDQQDDAYATWRDAHDDEPTLHQAFTAGWDARETRNRALRDMVQQGERHGLYRNEQLASPPPTREQIAEHIYRGLYPQSMFVFERETSDCRERCLRAADAVLALFPQPTPSAEAWYVAVQAKRAEQRAKGYTADHDREHGVEHLLSWAKDYASRGRHLDAAALVEAAREVLVWQRGTKSDYDVVDEQYRGVLPPAEPVSIADMAPGATLSAGPCCDRPGDPNWHTLSGGHVVPPDVEEETGSRTEPPRQITDMSPGTRFTAVDPGRLGDRATFEVLNNHRARDVGTWVHWAATSFDPSTIRDVTPPPATPEEGDRG